MDRAFICGITPVNFNKLSFNLITTFDVRTTFEVSLLPSTRVSQKFVIVIVSKTKDGAPKDLQFDPLQFWVQDFKTARGQVTEWAATIILRNFWRGSFHYDNYKPSGWPSYTTCADVTTLILFYICIRSVITWYHIHGIPDYALLRCTI